MNTLQDQDNRCHECKKLFCCASCRDSHEKKKHTRPVTDEDCLLCSRQKLPLQKFENSNFLCHLVTRHLPMICVLCGQLYRSSSDLENFSKCEYWRKRSRQSLPQDSTKKLPVQATPSPIVKSISCPAASCQKDSPDSEFHTLQSFTSPPELIRNTSTPMNVGVSGQNLKPQFKTPNKFPALFLKTPKTPIAPSAKNKSTPIGLTSNNETIDKDPSPSLLFYSAKSQLLLNSKEVNSDNTPFGSINSGSRSFIGGDTPSRSGAAAATPNRLSEEVSAGYSREFFRTNSARILEVMEEQEELQITVDMDLTEAQNNYLDAVSTAADSPNPPSGTASIAEPAKEASKKVRFSDQHQFMAAESTVDHVSDSEEFYEAPEIPTAEKSIADKKSDAQMMRENEDNSDKENLETPEESKVFETQSPPPTASTATSSRVVMMVVVENGFDISTSSLVPLINSSLQKLERNPLTESITSSMSSVSNQLQTAPNGTLRSVSSLDSYTASSTVDYYSPEVTPNNLTVPRPQTGGSSASSGNIGGGILSAMAQAMRYAFRGLPGGSSKHSPENFAPQTAGSSSNGSRGSPSSFSTIATSLLRRPGKRSRDPMNDGMFAHRRELRSPRNESGVSPVAKRPRSWHKIRGRDPIARMRRDTPSTSTTRGVSSETQHFQQGELSVGDTVIPLPSRAHQSTQTD